MFGARPRVTPLTRSRKVAHCAEEVFELVGRDPVVDVAVALENVLEKTSTSSTTDRSSSPSRSTFRRCSRAMLFSTEFFTGRSRRAGPQGVLSGRAPEADALGAPRRARLEQLDRGQVAVAAPVALVRDPRREPCSGEDRMWNVAPSNASRAAAAGETVEMAASRYRGVRRRRVRQPGESPRGSARGRGARGERPRACPRRVLRGVVEGQRHQRARRRAHGRARVRRRRRLPSVENSLAGRKRCFFSSGASRVSLIRRRSVIPCMYIVLANRFDRAGTLTGMLTGTLYARPRKPTELPVPRGLSPAPPSRARTPPCSARRAGRTPPIGARSRRVLSSSRPFPLGVRGAVRPVQRRVHARPPLAVPPSPVRLVRAPAQRFADRGGRASVLHRIQSSINAGLS